jgi:DNA invertase Pin-like site-specific DNA recombinase
MLKTPAPVKAGAVLYCRVSTKDQLENFSMETQEAACRQHSKRLGCEVLKVFLEAESAKDTKRPQFQAMLEYCSRNRARISVVVVYAVSRFARNVLDHLRTSFTLKGYGIRLESATEPISTTPIGKFNELIMAGFAEFDNDLRAERTIDGMKAAIAFGNWVHKPPIGYRSVIQSERSQPNIEPDPTKAPLVRRVFELCYAGESKADILKTVTAMGLTSPMSGRPLSPQFLDKILRNPIYSGLICIPTWNICAAGRFEPIVNPDLFKSVQKILDGGCGFGVTHSPQNGDFPLRVFVRCSVCGKGLTGSFATGRRGKKYPYYFCRTSGCRSAKFPRDVLHDIFVALLDSLVPSDRFTTLFDAVVLDLWKKKHQEQLEAIQIIRTRIAELEVRKQRIFDMFAEGRIAPDVYEKPNRESWNRHRRG